MYRSSQPNVRGYDTDLDICPVETKTVTKKYMISPKASHDRFLKAQHDLLRSEASSFVLNPFPDGRRIAYRPGLERTPRRSTTYEENESLSLKKSKELRKNILNSISRSPQRDNPLTQKYMREYENEERKIMETLVPDYVMERQKKLAQRFINDEDVSSVQSTASQCKNEETSSIRSKISDRKYKKLLTALERMMKKLKAAERCDEKVGKTIEEDDDDTDPLMPRKYNDYYDAKGDGDDASQSVKCDTDSNKTAHTIRMSRSKSETAFEETDDQPAKDEPEILNEPAESDQKSVAEVDSKHKDLSQLQTAKLIMMELINQKIEEIGKGDGTVFKKDFSAGDFFAGHHSLHHCRSSLEVRQMKQMRQKYLTEIKQLVDRVGDMDKTIESFWECGHNFP